MQTTDNTPALSGEKAYPAQLETAMAAYLYLLQEEQLDSRRICIAGDSAGGNKSVYGIHSIRKVGH